MALEPVKRRVNRSFQQQTREVGVTTPTKDVRSQILTSLGNFAEAGYNVASTEVQKQIEADKIKQADRAAKDLMRGVEERQGISEDSTKAGQLAYNMIVGKHDTMNAGNEFLQWYEQNPDADDDTITQQKESLFKPLMDKYGTDQQTLKAISLQVQDAQFSIVQAQNQIKKSHQDAKANEALGISISDLLANPNADIDNLVNSEVPARAKALGRTEFEYKAALIKQASASAGNGDARLLDHLKGQAWAKNNPALTTAQNKYDTYIAEEKAEVIGDLMGDIEMQALSGNVSWEHTLRRIEQTNDKWRGTYSAARISSLKKQRQSEIDKRNALTKMTVDATNVYSDENAIPLGLRTDYTPKQKKDYIRQMEAKWASKTTELIESGASDSDANTAIIKAKLDFSRVQRMVVPSLKDNLDALINLNPEDTTAEDLPAYATTALQVLNMMDDTSLGMYFTNEDNKTMAMNIQSGMKNRSPYQAFRRAYEIRRNPYNISSEQRTDQRDEAINQVEDELNAKWYQFGKKDVPSWQRDKIANRVGEDSQSYLYRGGLDIERNAKVATKSYLANFSQTFNNTLINKPKPELAASIGIHANNVDTYFKNFVTNTLTSEEIAPLGIAPEDVEIVVNDTGNTFILVDSYGEQIGGRYLMQDVKTYGDKMTEESLKALAEGKLEERKTSAQVAEETEESAHMALFYLQQRGYR